MNALFRTFSRLLSCSCKLSFPCGDFLGHSELCSLCSQEYSRRLIRIHLSECYFLIKLKVWLFNYWILYSLNIGLRQSLITPIKLTCMVPYKAVKSEVTKRVHYTAFSSKSLFKIKEPLFCFIIHSNTHQKTTYSPHLN